MEVKLVKMYSSLPSLYDKLHGTLSLSCIESDNMKGFEFDSNNLTLDEHHEYVYNISLSGLIFCA